MKSPIQTPPAHRSAASRSSASGVHQLDSCGCKVACIGPCVFGTCIGYCI